MPSYPNWVPKRFRTIREEPKFIEQLEALAISHKKLDEVLAGVYFSLSLDAERNPKIAGTDFSVIKTQMYPDAPALQIVFTYSPTEVHLLAVGFIDEETE